MCTSAQRSDMEYGVIDNVRSGETVSKVVSSVPIGFEKSDDESGLTEENQKLVSDLIHILSALPDGAVEEVRQVLLLKGIGSKTKGLSP